MFTWNPTEVQAAVQRSSDHILWLLPACFYLFFFLLMFAIVWPYGELSQIWAGWKLPFSSTWLNKLIFPFLHKCGFCLIFLFFSPSKGTERGKKCPKGREGAADFDGSLVKISIYMHLVSVILVSLTCVYRFPQKALKNPASYAYVQVLFK